MNSFYARILAAIVLTCSFCSISYAQEQELMITGKVVAAEDGSGLPGVNVVNTTRKTGAQSDIEGMYKVKAMVGDILEFRFLGYTTETRTVGALVVIDVTLKEETKQLKEAVVIGYGTTTKKDMTGSVASVSSKDFQKGVISTPDQLISGKVAGVQITNNGGGPGSGSTIRIRGGASLKATNDPLIVIDGVPIDNVSVKGSPSILALINPNDIESVTVLKDASATAIYGSRASNGVIIYTTKKGSKGAKPTLSFTSQFSISTIAKRLNVLNGDQYRKLVLDSGTGPQKQMLGKYNTDWQKVIFQPARTSDNALSFTGGRKNLSYRLSGGWFEQEGILRTDKLQRQTISLNVTPEFFDNSLKVGLNMKLSRSQSRFTDAGVIGTAVSFDPTQPVYNITSEGISPRYGGYYEWLNNDGKPNTQAARNPLGLLEMYNKNSEAYRSIANITLDYKPSFFPDISFNLNGGYDIGFGQEMEIVSDSAARNYYDKGLRSRSKEGKQNLLLDGYVKYLKYIPNLKSKVDVMIGASYQDFQLRQTFYRSKNYYGEINPLFTNPTFPSDRPQNRLISAFGRLNYTFNEKYLVTATFRRDGSSRFAENVRWGFFPSAAFAWQIKEESFLKNVNAISDLKIRIGYGETGQQDIGLNYAYIPKYTIADSSARIQFGDSSYRVYRPEPFDPNLHWETTKTYNAGIDFGFLDGKISGSLDVYYKKTDDLLNQIKIPVGLNFSDNVTTNFGNLENRGLEFSINYDAISTDDWSWTVGGNATYNKNRILSLFSLGDTVRSGITAGSIGLDRYIQYQTEGAPINSFRVYEQVYGANGKPIENSYVDQNGDGKINNDDLILKHSPAPTMMFGFSSSVRYKQLSLSTVARANVGNYVYNSVDGGGAYFNSTKGINAASNIPSSYYNTNFKGADDKRFYSSYYLRNASFLRIDNINLVYDFGEVSEGWLLSTNFTVQNVAVFTKYKGIDPEIFNGVDSNIYPRPRTFVIGLSLTH